MGAITGTVRAVCVSDARGVQKRDVGSAVLQLGWGVEGDAHGGDWHRQVSLLSYDKIQQFNEKGAGVGYGDFGENVIVEGIDFSALPPGTRLTCNEAELAITQIGKECHTRCAIYHKMNDCIMPREGVFARVTREGRISAGDTMTAVLPANDRIRAAVVTLSDRCAAGERPDESGPLISRMLLEAGYQVEAQLLLPDERVQIEA